MITIESILLDRVNELSQELAGVKHDLQLATVKANDLEKKHKDLDSKFSIVYTDRQQVTSDVLSILHEIYEVYQRAEKDGATSFMEDVKEILNEWNKIYSDI